MLLGLETFSYIPWFIAGRMDVFGFIRRSKELGLDGVQLNIGVPQDNWGMFGGADPARIKAVRALCEELGLFVEVCYSYRAPFRVPEGEGAGQRLGSGAFRVAPPPHDPACIAPYPNYLNPASLPAAECEQFLQWCDRAVIDSVAHVRELDRHSSTAARGRP